MISAASLALTLSINKLHRG